MEIDSMKNGSLANPVMSRPTVRFQPSPDTHSRGEALADLRDDLRLKKHLQHAVGRETAPASLIDAIRDRIRS